MTRLKETISTIPSSLRYPIKVSKWEEMSLKEIKDT